MACVMLVNKYVWYMKLPYAVLIPVSQEHFLKIEFFWPIDLKYEAFLK